MFSLLSFSEGGWGSALAAGTLVTISLALTTLPVGILLGLAVALMTRPRVLLLDEPTRHLAPAVAGSVLDLVRSLAIDDGVAVLMAEVNVAAALAVADRAYVMRSGTILASHDAAALRAAGPTAWWDMF
jgi:ABC-type branched-subunit amino acid transport system ATPase component